MHAGLMVGESRNGKGIFAARDFEPEEVLYEVTGSLVTGDIDDPVDETVRANTFRFNADFYISPAGTVGDFQNHSCEPNAKVVKREDHLYVVAAKQIQRGKEVLIDYSTIIAADDGWEMDCNCGAERCRGRIRSFDTLPAALRTRYMREGIVPQYIVELSS